MSAFALTRNQSGNFIGANLGKPPHRYYDGCACQPSVRQLFKLNATHGFTIRRISFAWHVEALRVSILSVMSLMSSMALCQAITVPRTHKPSWSIQTTLFFPGRTCGIQSNPSQDCGLKGVRPSLQGFMKSPGPRSIANHRSACVRSPPPGWLSDFFLERLTAGFWPLLGLSQQKWLKVAHPAPWGVGIALTKWSKSIS